MDYTRFPNDQEGAPMAPPTLSPEEFMKLDES